MLLYTEICSMLCYCKLKYIYCLTQTHTHTLECMEEDGKLKLLSQYSRDWQRFLNYRQVFLPHRASSIIFGCFPYPSPFPKKEPFTIIHLISALPDECRQHNSNDYQNCILTPPSDYRHCTSHQDSDLVNQFPRIRS